MKFLGDTILQQSLVLIIYPVPLPQWCLDLRCRKLCCRWISWSRAPQLCTLMDPMLSYQIKLMLQPSNITAIENDGNVTFRCFPKYNLNSHISLALFVYLNLTIVTGCMHHTYLNNMLSKWSIWKKPKWMIKWIHFSQGEIVRSSNTVITCSYRVLFI